MYNSQYYTCEQIDQRLLQGYLDDYNSQNSTSLTKAQFLTKLYDALENYEDESEVIDLIEDYLGSGFLYAGLATPTGTPSLPQDHQAQLFFIAISPGTYTNYGNINITNVGLHLILWDTDTWSYDTVLEVDQQTGQSTTKTMSQKAITDLLSLISDSNIKANIGYYECDTAGATAAKVISVANYALFVGGAIKIKMSNANSAANATLNINSTGAKPLYYDGARASSTNTWEAGEVLDVYYDGTNFQANNSAGGGKFSTGEKVRETGIAQGSDFDNPTSAQRELVTTVGSVLDGISEGVFDLTAKTGDSYATLADALTAANTSIPTNKKKGGMSIKFVQSSDNKYVQYRLMADTWSISASDWQGVDDEPTAGSDNLVKSGGVKKSLVDVAGIVIPVTEEGHYIKLTDGVGTAIGNPQTSQTLHYSRYKVHTGDIVIVNAYGADKGTWAFIDENGIILSYGGNFDYQNNLRVVAPQDAHEVIINSNKDYDCYYYPKQSLRIPELYSEDSNNELYSQLGLYSISFNAVTSQYIDEKIYQSFKAGDVIRLAISGTFSLPLSLYDDSGTTLRTVYSGNTYDIVIESATKYLRLYRKGADVLQGGTINVSVSRQFANNITDNIASIIDASGLPTLEAQNTIIKTDGDLSANTYSGYNVYRLDMASIPDGYSVLLDIVTGGSGMSLVYGYGTGGTKFNQYAVATSSNKTARIIVEKEEGLSYLLLQKSNNRRFGVFKFKAGLSLDVLLGEKEDASNKVNTLDNSESHYPSSKAVSDVLNQIVVTTNEKSNITLFQSNAYISTAGAIVGGVSGYVIYKFALDNVDNDASINITTKTTGANISLVYGYDSIDAPQKNYFTAPSAGTYDITFKKESGIAYILISSNNVNNIQIKTVTPGNVIKEITADSSKIVYHNISVSPSGVGENSLIGVLMSLMADSSDEKPSYNHRYNIHLSAGTYDMDYSGETVSNQYGLFVMPYTTIIGKGRGVTKLEYKYTGTDNDVMSKHSVLNMPYTSELRDMTLIAENIRYTIHSDGNIIQGNSPHYTDVTLKNVELIHLGINNGVTPTFNLPSAWGGGTFNGNHLRFDNCRFEAYQCCPFGNHDRTGLVASSYFDFVNCDFISHAPANNYVSFNTKEVGVLLNSWGSDIPIYCNFINCRMNRHIALIVTTTQGNANAVNDYYVKVDNDQTVVAVQSINDSNKTRHYSTGACREMLFTSAQSLGTPVRMYDLREGKAYSSSTQVCYGILLHDVGTNEIGVVMHKGLIPTTNLLTGTFTVGKTYGWSGGTWVEDNEHPILKVVSYEICEIL